MGASYSVYPDGSSEWDDDFEQDPDDFVDEDFLDDEDEDTDEHMAIKRYADGARTLAEASAMFRQLADVLQECHDEGWVLREPVDNGQFFYYKPGDE